jgi:DNA-binding XRE family transcriptional regulator
MVRKFEELRARMDPADVADNQRRVREELQRMALQELRSARQLTQADMAEILDVPQSSICRIEQRADMYLSTLRNYVQALGGVLQIQAVFPDTGAVVINRFGDYEDQPYVVRVRAMGEGSYRLCASPLYHSGMVYSTRVFKVSGLVRAMKALHFGDPLISSIRKGADKAGDIEVNGSVAQRVFNIPDLIAAGFEAVDADPDAAILT